MKSFKSLLCLLVSILFLSNCHNDKKSKEEVPTLKITSDLMQHKIKFSDLIRDYKFIPLETTDECLIGQVDKIFLKDDKFYIFDSKKTKAILIFSLQGKFIGKISKMGRGPGEFAHAIDFCIEPSTNNIAILDENYLKYYKDDGTFVKKTLLPYFGEKFEFPDKGHIAFYNREPGQRLIITDTLGKIEKSYFEYIKETIVLLHIPFIQSPKEGLLYLTNLDYTIYKITGNQLSPHFKIDFGNHMFTSENLPELRENRRNEDKFYNINYYFESPNTIFIIFLYNRTSYLLIVNKKTNKTIVINYNDIDNNVTFTKRLPLIRMVDSTDTFVSYFDSNTFITDPTQIKTSSVELMEIITNSKPTNNPVLFLFKFK